MASEQAKEAAVATAKESTTPTDGNDAILQAAPTVGAIPGTTEAGGSGTLSDLLKTGDGRREPPKLPLFSLSKDKRNSTALDDAAAPGPNGVARSLVHRASAHLARKATRDLP
jgi:hypothetical protein